MVGARVVLSCGVLIHRLGERGREYLFLRVYRNLDLPKGRCEPGESERDCALRELGEETGIGLEDIALVDGFRFTTRYASSERGGGRIDKTLVVFLAQLLRPVAIRLSEHHGVVWMPVAEAGALITRWRDLLVAAERQLAEPG